MFRIVDQHLDFNGLAPMIRASGDFKNRTGDDPAVFMHFECDGDSDFDLRQFGGRQIHDRKQLIVINRDETPADARATLVLHEDIAKVFETL